MTRHIQDDLGQPLCKSWQDGDELVLAAMQSDCRPCRTAAKMGLPTEKSDEASRRNDPYAVRPVVPPWEPKPYPNAESVLAEKQLRVDGRWPPEKPAEPEQRPPDPQSCGCDGALDTGCFFCTPTDWACATCGFPLALESSKKFCPHCRGMHLGEEEWRIVAFSGRVPLPVESVPNG